MQKIKNLEFLRIVGCLAVVLLHLFAQKSLCGAFPDIYLYHKLDVMTANGQKAVDMFFILSGFFFALKLNVTKSIWVFLKSKLQRFYPVLIFCIIMSFIASLFGLIEFAYYDNILALCGLGGTSLVLNIDSNVGVFWYVSAMLWVFMLLYYLLKNYDKKHINLLIALLIFFCYSFVIHAKDGRIDHHYQTFYFIFNIGLMRAFAGIGVGYFIAEWFKSNIESIKSFVPHVMQKILITVIEFMCVFFIINNLMLHNPNFKNHMVYIIVFIITIILFLVRKGFISQWLERDCCVILSKYTYSIYMTHMILYDILRKSFWKDQNEWVYLHPILNVLITLSLVFLLGILSYHIIEAPANKYFSKYKG